MKKILFSLLLILLFIPLAKGVKILPIRADNNFTNEGGNPKQVDFPTFGSSNFSVVFTSNKSSAAGNGNVFWSLTYLNLAANSFQMKAEDDTGTDQIGQSNWLAVKAGDYDLGTGKLECGTAPASSAADPSITTAAFNTSFPDTNYSIICNPESIGDSPVCNPRPANKKVDSAELLFRADTGGAQLVSGANWCAISHGNHTVDGVEIKAGSDRVENGLFNISFGPDDQMPSEDYVVLITIVLPNTGLDCTCDVQTRTIDGFNGTCYDDGASSVACVSEQLDWIALEKIDRNLSLEFEDTLSPIINGTANKTLTDIFQNDIINFTFNVTDNINITNVTITINDTADDVRYFNFTNLPNSPDTTIEVSQNFTVNCASGCVINVSGKAIDNSSNFALNDTIFTVTELAPPDITLPIINGTANKSLTDIFQNDIINFTFNVTDNLNITNVTIVINDTDDNVRYFNFTNLENSPDTTIEISQNFTVNCAVGCVINITGIAIDNSSNIAINDTVFNVTELHIPTATAAVDIGRSILAVDAVFGNRILRGIT